jgi:hypothetical protein
LRLKMEEMGSEISDTQFLLHVMNNLTPEYENQVNLLERRIDDEFNPLSIEDLREEFNLHYERLNIQKRDENHKDWQDQDHALYAGGQFKGKCRLCGKTGHKAVDCRLRNADEKNKYNNNESGNKDNNRGKTFTGTCNYCGKVGHKYAECRKRIKENASGTNTFNAFKSGGIKNNPSDRANNAKEIESGTEDIVLLADENLQIEIGECPNCRDFGPLGTYCNECEDSGMIYESRNNNVNENSSSDMESENENSPSVSTVNESHDLNDLHSFIENMVYEHEQLRIQQETDRIYECLIDMGITSVHHMIENLVYINDWLLENDRSNLRNQEVLELIELGIDWEQSKNTNNEIFTTTIMILC